jgi:hypothetical protein
MIKLKNKIDGKKYMKKDRYQFGLEFYTCDKVIRPRPLQQKKINKTQFYANQILNDEIQKKITNFKKGKK